MTIGPVVKLWRRARRRFEMPDAQQLAEARGLIGWKNVWLDPDARTVELTVARDPARPRRDRQGVRRPTRR